MNPVLKGAQNVTHFAKHSPFVNAVSILFVDFMAARVGLTGLGAGTTGESKVGVLEGLIVAELAKKQWTAAKRAVLFADANRYIHSILDAVSVGGGRAGVSFRVGHVKDETRVFR
jgi:hypothetical protein